MIPNEYYLTDKQLAYAFDLNGKSARGGGARMQRLTQALHTQLLLEVQVGNREPGLATLFVPNFLSIIQLIN